jgi:DNA-binding transcriptional LysR family regulator
MSTPTMTEALLGRRVDVGFLHPPVEAAGAEELVAIEAMMSEPLIVALPEGHELSGLPEVPLGRLAQDPFVIVPRDEGPELHNRIMGTCHASGISPAVANQNAPSHTTAVGLVAAGVGVSLVWECMRNLRRPGVVYRPLAEQTTRLETALAWRLDDPSPVLAAFLALAKEIAGKTKEHEAEPDADRPSDVVLSSSRGKVTRAASTPPYGGEESPQMMQRRLQSSHDKGYKKILH